MPRLKYRAEAFEVLYDYKVGDLDIGEAFDILYNMFTGSRSQKRTKTGFGRLKPKRKLSAWNKFVKANSKKPRFRLRSGSPNLKKLGVAFRKTPAGKKRRK